MNPRDVERFWSKVDKTDACWLWTDALTGAGYGVFCYGSRTDGSRRKVGAHRFAYELLVGPIPDGRDLDHLCRNRVCVNPGHLEPVTRQENLRRGVNGYSVRTHCPRNHLYDEVNTRIYKGSRVCRACERDRSTERRKKAA